MSRNRRDDRHRLIGVLVQLQERRGRRWHESDRDYIIRLAIQLADDGFYLEWARQEPLTVESLFPAADALRRSS